MPKSNHASTTKTNDVDFGFEFVSGFAAAAETADVVDFASSEQEQVEELHQPWPLVGTKALTLAS